MIFCSPMLDNNLVGTEQSCQGCYKRTITITRRRTRKCFL
ncbi:hypothetical protein EVA_01214 [gut metagenome]|uniref:Uncharacterized protein n=1 Tax=gut metagenome TaxID=749906 RepID=J9GQ74_9ZZZZ